MIKKYVFGKPYETYSCVLGISPERGALPYFTVEKTGRGLCFRIPLDDNDAVYGLGENVRGINKRGFLYRSSNVDNAPETEGRSSLYASHNFMAVKGDDKCFGVFFDDPAWFEFDVGFTRPDEAVMTSRYGDLTVYILEAPALNSIVADFHRLIGRSYLPPKWAFGYMQSRFGDMSDEYISDTLSEYDRLGIPIDAYCIDIDCLDAYQNFTWSREKFPDPERFVKEKLAEGIHVVPIVDVAIRQSEDNRDYVSGRAADVFCKGGDGAEFTGYVWPGKCVFPDYFQQKTQSWFGSLYRRYLEIGVHGFWNDMNEPSIFASDAGLKRAAELADRARGEFGVMQLAQLKDTDRLLYNEETDADSFCHMIDGVRVPNARVHNLYGAMMSHATNRGFEDYDPDMRFLLFMRSSYIGSHRYAGVWLGDNSAWWSHLLQNLKWMPSMNMCGYLFTGADIGGFNEDATDELLLRWLQLGVFLPLMRNHSAWGTRKQELHRFTYKEQMAKAVNIRYALIPYIYSEYMKAALRYESLYRPLAFDYPKDRRACRIEDQLMLGGECMLAPIYEQNGRGRFVYLPEDMLMIRMRAADDYEQLRMCRGDHYIEAAVDQLVFFIRKNRAIPLAKPARRVKDIDYGSIRMIGWLEQPYSYELYDDDGLSKRVSLESIRRIECEA